MRAPALTRPTSRIQTPEPPPAPLLRARATDRFKSVTASVLFPPTTPPRSQKRKGVDAHPPSPPATAGQSAVEPEPLLLSARSEKKKKKDITLQCIQWRFVTDEAEEPVALDRGLIVCTLQWLKQEKAGGDPFLVAAAHKIVEMGVLPPEKVLGLSYASLGLSTLTCTRLMGLPTDKNRRYIGYTFGHAIEHGLQGAKASGWSKCHVLSIPDMDMSTNVVTCIQNTVSGADSFYKATFEVLVHLEDAEDIFILQERSL